MALAASVAGIFKQRHQKEKNYHLREKDRDDADSVNDPFRKKTRKHPAVWDAQYQVPDSRETGVHHIHHGLRGPEERREEPCQNYKENWEAKNAMQDDSINAFGDRVARPRARTGARRRAALFQQPPQTAVSSYRLAGQLRQWATSFYRF